MSTTVKDQFEITPGYRKWTMGLIAVGVLSLIIGFVVYGAGDRAHQTIFWGSLLHNSVYWLLVVNAAMFFFAATTLAMAGFQTSFRRVGEAIGACVPVIGSITLVVLLCIVLGGKDFIYEWLNKATVEHDHILKGKSGFLNPGFFLTWSFLAVGLWWILGLKLRQLSRSTDDHKMTVEEGRVFTFKNSIWAALFIVWFGLSVAAVVPWLWLMSTNAHWFSTMFSWYVFASSFVPGIALISLFVIYLKNQGYLPYTNQQHLHDLGKFQFAFSIFWTYVWFDQFMLIWYANISEETIYFQSRFGTGGHYVGLFYLNLIINFLAPILIYMSNTSKRNYTVVTFMSVALIFGHWIDFYQMIFGNVMPDRVPLGLFDFGIAAGFIGVIMLQTGRVLAKFPLLGKNHPFFKESIIHHV